MRNVKVTLDKTSKWDCGIYDLRPAVDYGITDSKNSCIFIKNAKDVLLSDTKAQFGNVCSDYAHGLYCENVDGLETYRFSAESASEEYENIKIV